MARQEAAEKLDSVPKSSVPKRSWEQVSLRLNNEYPDLTIDVLVLWVSSDFNPGCPYQELRRSGSILVEVAVIENIWDVQVRHGRGNCRGLLTKLQFYSLRFMQNFVHRFLRGSKSAQSFRTRRSHDMIDPSSRSSTFRVQIGNAKKCGKLEDLWKPLKKC